MGLVALDMGHCRLRKFPSTVLEMKTLEHLCLSNSQDYVDDEARIKGLPREIGGLTKLRVFEYDFNVLETMPDELFTLTQLEELSLFNCSLPKEIPIGLARLKRLRKLDVSYSDWSSRKEELVRILPKRCEIG